MVSSSSVDTFSLTVSSTSPLIASEVWSTITESSTAVVMETSSHSSMTETEVLSSSMMVS